MAKYLDPRFSHNLTFFLFRWFSAYVPNLKTSLSVITKWGSRCFDFYYFYTFLFAGRGGG